MIGKADGNIECNSVEYEKKMVVNIKFLILQMKTKKY